MNIELSAEEIQMVQAALSNHKDKLWSQIHELQHPFKGYDVRLHEKWRAKADEAIALSKRIGSDFAAPSSQAVSVPEGAFLIIGYGESDIPDARYATTPEEIRAAFAALVFGDPKACGEEADSEIEDLVEGFNNPDEWSGDGRWSVTFEIGGINAYRLAAPAAATREGKG